MDVSNNFNFESNLYLSTTAMNLNSFRAAYFQAGVYFELVVETQTFDYPTFLFCMRVLHEECTESFPKCISFEAV